MIFKALILTATQLSITGAALPYEIDPFATSDLLITNCDEFIYCNYNKLEEVKRLQLLRVVN